jgi:hypothetical protein
MAATESGLDTTLRSSVASIRTELVGPGTTLADERLLPVVPALRPLLPGQGLRRGTTVAVSRSAALALALVAAASAAGSWVAAVGLPDLGIVAAAESGIALERLALVPVPGARVWPTVVAALLDAVDVVLVRSPARLGPPRPAASRPGLSVGGPGPRAWPEPADPGRHLQRLERLGQGHGRLQAARSEVPSPVAAPPPTPGPSGCPPQRHDRPGPLQPGRGRAGGGPVVRTAGAAAGRCRVR